MFKFTSFLCMHCGLVNDIAVLNITGLSTMKEATLNESSISLLLKEEAQLRQLQGILF